MTTDFNNQFEEIDLDEVLSGLEGIEAQTFRKSNQVVEGLHRCRVNSVRTVTKSGVHSDRHEKAGEEYTITLALFELEMLDPPYRGREIRHTMPMPKVAEDGTLNDGMFTQSVRRVFGDDDYASKIAGLSDYPAQIKAAFEEFPGYEAAVRFVKNDNAKDDPDAAAWPRGGFLNVDVLDDVDDSDVDGSLI